MNKLMLIISCVNISLHVVAQQHTSAASSCISSSSSTSLSAQHTSQIAVVKSSFITFLQAIKSKDARAAGEQLTRAIWLSSAAEEDWAFSAWLQAIQNGNAELAGGLLVQNLTELSQMPVDYDAQFIEVLRTEDIGAIKQFLQNKTVSPNIEMIKGFSALYWAACRESADLLVPLLVDAKLNVNMQNSSGETALDAAIFSEAELAVDKLLEAGANVNHSSSFRDTPLMRCCRGNIRNIAIARKLLEKGAKATIDTHDIYGWTALMRAAMWGNGALVSLLLEAGANASLRNLEQQTALMIAQDRVQGANGNLEGYARVISLLLNPSQVSSSSSSSSSSSQSLPAVEEKNDDVPQ